MTKKENQRPTLVKIICIIFFILVPIAFLTELVMLLFPKFSMIALGKIMPLWYSLFRIFSVILEFILIFYIWKMKRWALNLFAFWGILVEYAVNFSLGVGSLIGLIISLIMIGLLYTKYKEMG